MRFYETALIYVVIGSTFALASLLLEARTSMVKSALAFVVNISCWPLLAPFLISRPRPRRTEPRGSSFDGRIDLSEARLIDALERIDGIAPDVLTPEIDRVRGLATALRTMAQRSGEMNALLATPEFSRERAVRLLAELEDTIATKDDPRAESIRARIANIDRLESMRARTVEGLERALLEVEEMGSRIALLRFTDHPDREVLRMIHDIAASVDGVATVVQFAVDSTESTAVGGSAG